MSSNPITIAVTGKGGVGKTSFTALLLKSLLLNNYKRILVIDADPASNLADVLGISPITTVGQLVDKTKREVEQKSDSYSGTALLEFRLWETALLEKSRFSFIAMGHTTGRGCYCMINDILSHLLDNIKGYYDIVLMDMDAGLEHISRNTKRTINSTLLLTDPSKMGFQTVYRILQLTKELHSHIGYFFLVGNMFKTSDHEVKLRNFAETLQIPYLGAIPLDTDISIRNIQGKSLIDISIETPAFRSVNQILLDLMNSIN